MSDVNDVVNNIACDICGVYWDRGAKDINKWRMVCCPYGKGHNFWDICSTCVDKNSKRGRDIISFRKSK